MARPLVRAPSGWPPRKHATGRPRLIAVMTYGKERVLGAPAGQPVATLSTASDERTVAESNLRDAVIDALGTQADHVELRVVAGTAGRQLVEAARELGAQLIVPATRGSMSLLLGTVSQYVLRKAPCPVLIVPAVAVVDASWGNEPGLGGSYRAAAAP